MNSKLKSINLLVQKTFINQAVVEILFQLPPEGFKNVFVHQFVESSNCFCDYVDDQRKLLVEATQSEDQPVVDGIEFVIVTDSRGGVNLIGYEILNAHRVNWRHVEIEHWGFCCWWCEENVNEAMWKLEFLIKFVEAFAVWIFKYFLRAFKINFFIRKRIFRRVAEDVKVLANELVWLLKKELTTKPALVPKSFVSYRKFCKIELEFLI